MKQHTVIKNSLITAGILGAATGFCFLIQEAAESDTHVPLLFVLAVLFISRFTDGYIYGIVASMIAVVGVNYVFTYPYFAIDFTITGYPGDIHCHAGRGLQRQRPDDPDQKAGADPPGGRKGKDAGEPFKGRIPRHTDAPDLHHGGRVCGPGKLRGAV